MICSDCKHSETCPDVGRPCDHWRHVPVRATNTDYQESDCRRCTHCIEQRETSIDCKLRKVTTYQEGSEPRHCGYFKEQRFGTGRPLPPTHETQGFCLG